MVQLWYETPVEKVALYTKIYFNIGHTKFLEESIGG